MAGHRTRRRFGAGNGNTRENSAKLKYKLLVAPAVVIGFLIVYGLVSLQAVRSGIALAQSAGESTREITERMEAMVREVSSISAALKE